MSTPNKQTTQSWFEGMMKKIAPGMNPEEVEILRTDFNKRYTDAIGSTNETLNTPRTSTAPQSLDQARDAGLLNIELKDAARPGQERHGDYLLNARDKKLNQNSDYQQRATDTHTDAAMRLLGGSQREVIGDGYASKAATLQGNLDYKRSFDDKYFGAIERMHEAEQAQANRGFIKDLALTAATLFVG